MIELVLQAALVNAALVTLLALPVWLLAKWIRSAPVARGLWLLVLVKLITPPIVPWPAVTWTPEPTRALRTLETANVTHPGFKAEFEPATTPPAGARQVLRATAINWPAALATIWLAGSASWVITAGLRAIRFSALVRRATAAPADWQTEAERLATRMGLRRCPPVRCVSGHVSPLLWSLCARPVILLPRELVAQLSARQRAMVLAHELAHLAGSDHWTRRLEVVVLGIYWWHPIAWLACRQAREAEELCCDGWVAWLWPDSSRDYAGLLVDTLDYLAAGSALPVGASGFARIRQLSRRLDMILKGELTRRLSRGSRIALAVFALPVLLFSVTARSADVPPPQTAHSASNGQTSQEALLLGRVSCDVVGGTLTEFIKQISGGSEPARIVLDEVALRDDCGLTSDTRVTLQAQQIRRQSALHIVLGPRDAGFYVKDGAIHVTSQSALETDALVERRYYVADLSGSRWQKAMGRTDGTTTLIEFITSTVRPHTWETTGGPATIRPSADKRYIEVRQAARAHDDVARLLAQLRGLPASPEDAKTLVGQVHGRFSLHCVGRPLAELLREISATYDVNIHLDEVALAKSGCSRDTPVTVHVDNVTLSQVLNLLLAPLSLTYVVENEVIEITSAKSDDIYTVTYAVADLLKPVRRASGKAAHSDFASLVDRIKQEAAPGTWGWQGEVSSFPDNLSLVISHNEVGHDAVRSLLNTLRRSSLGSPPPAPSGQGP
jgi:beta-lactamase regulating signal transducer with metallopeptidase domain